METLAVLLIALLVLGFALVSRRSARSSVTPPMVFTLSGLACGLLGLSFLEVDAATPFLTFLAEATLIFVLFTDASRIDVRRLPREAVLPFRMLSIGMPLQILFGAVLALLLFPELSLWQAGLLASVLAPTDAALGQAVVTSRKVPIRVRQTLNIESGLNDGLALPIVTIFVATCLTVERQGSAAEWGAMLGKQLLFGLLVGLLVGGVSALLIERASARGWMETSFRQIGTLAGAVTAYSLATAVEGNGFIAAFVAGATFGTVVPHHGEALLDFAEEEGQLLALLTFFFFGAVLLPPALQGLGWRGMVYGVASLTVVRMLPVALSLVGCRLRAPTVAFLAWFGPRGLASILFALLIVEASEVENAELIVGVAFSTVLGSVVLHGVTARPFSNRLAGSLETARSEGEMAEMGPTMKAPIRFRGPAERS